MKDGKDGDLPAAHLRRHYCHRLLDAAGRTRSFRIHQTLERGRTRTNEFDSGKNENEMQTNMIQIHAP
jgi:hypothetical protein